jgi:hypothetical protein
MNYQWKMDGATCRIRPLGSRIILQTPKQTAQFVIESPFQHDRKSWKITGVSGSVLEANPEEPVLLPETFKGKISMVVNSEPLPELAEIQINRPVVWPFFRRLLAEGRDRFLPVS